MVKIKTKKEMTLPELIQWVWDNDIRNERYLRLNSDLFEYVWINDNSEIELDEDMCINKKDIFKVEVEEEITEDTVLPRLFRIVKNSDGALHLFTYRNMNIGNIVSVAESLGYYILNDDGTMTLIWKDGALV